MSPVLSRLDPKSTGWVVGNSSVNSYGLNRQVSVQRVGQTFASQLLVKDGRLIRDGPTRKEDSMGSAKNSRDVPKTDFYRLTVARFMEGSVQVARPETPANQIAEMMLEGFGAVPIVDTTQRLMGIVSEHDLLASLENHQKWAEISAKDIMTPNPYSVRPDTDLATLVHVLRVSNLIRVPVIVADDKLVGIVARRDILRAYLNYGVESP
jgi:CBS domain-containing protein